MKIYKYIHAHITLIFENVEQTEWNELYETAQESESESEFVYICKCVRRTKERKRERGGEGTMERVIQPDRNFNSVWKITSDIQVLK